MADRGYDPVMGARPLRRTIQRELEDSAPLRRAPSGPIVKVSVDGLGLVFTSEDAPAT